MEHSLVVCAQCGRIQSADGSWREPIVQKQGERHVLSREGICPLCERAVSGERPAGAHEASEAFALGALVQLLGGLETVGKEPSDASREH